MVKNAQFGRFMAWQQRMRANPHIARALTGAQYLLLILVLIYLVIRFAQVGWADVMNNLPQSVWFYVFFALRFLALPMSELFIYQMIWDVPLGRHWPAFLRKRVYNFAVIGYSGEGFLTLWARRKLPLNDKAVVVGVKDNNLLSALASNLATVFMIIGLVWAGKLAMGLSALPGGGGVLFVLAFTSSLVLSITVIVLHRRLIALPYEKLRPVFAIHGARTVLILVLHAAMYAAALPGAPLSAWLMFLALQLVLSRIPFIPNQDLVFLGAALSLAPLVNASEAALAGMLLAEAGLSQLINFVLFFATAHVARLGKSV
ncbi:MAG: hypothetical protein AAFU58_10205 [Pseudomonadota bacterium]